MKLDRATAAYVVALATVAAGLILGVLWLTPQAGRTALLSQGVAPLGGLLAAIGAAVSAKLAYQAREVAAAQTPVISQIQAQTNGLMTVGFSTAIGKALDSRGLTLSTPIAPVAPVAPVLPVAPIAPIAPIAPVLPVAPIAPLRTLEGLHMLTPDEAATLSALIAKAAVDVPVVAPVAVVAPVVPDVPFAPPVVPDVPVVAPVAVVVPDVPPVPDVAPVVTDLTGSDPAAPVPDAAAPVTAFFGGS